MRVTTLSPLVTRWDFSAYNVIGPSSGRAGQKTVRSVLAHAMALGGLLAVAGCAKVDQMLASLGAPPSSGAAGPEHLPLPPPPPPRAAHASASVPLDDRQVAVDGLSANAARALLGPPLTQVASGPGETWTYRSGRCELALYLFPDVANGGLRVLDHQVNGVGTRAADQQACVRRVQHAHGG